MNLEVTSNLTSMRSHVFVFCFGENEKKKTATNILEYLGPEERVSSYHQPNWFID